MALSDERLLDVTQKASEAFWWTVAQNLPEIKTGDVDPFTNLEWDDFTHKMVARWYEDNRPADRDELEEAAIDHLAEMLGHEACAYTLKATYPEIAVHLALYSAGDTTCD
jgi:hypothetical protein